MQLYNQLEIDSMHEQLNDTRVPEDPMGSYDGKWDTYSSLNIMIRRWRWD